MPFGKLFAYFLVISLMNLTGTGFFMSFYTHGTSPGDLGFESGTA